MCLKKDFLKLLDISNYLAPGFSYSQFLKAYECEQTKGFFPNQWLDNLDKLQETSLSPHASFSSTLKNHNTDSWRIPVLSASMGRLILVQLSGCIVPFLEAVEKMSQFWQARKIDMFKDDISVPGLPLKYL